jgi:hypothetical protein
MFNIAVIGQNLSIHTVFRIAGFAKLGSKSHFVIILKSIPISYKNGFLFYNIEPKK